MELYPPALLVKKYIRRLEKDAGTESPAAKIPILRRRPVKIVIVSQNVKKASQNKRLCYPSVLWLSCDNCMGSIIGMLV